MSQDVCLNCGATLTGKYCHACGQKRIEEKERRLKHFFYQFFGAAFFLENNFIKNLWYLLARPGYLAAEYVEGKRKRYMPPISLFLLINLFYFFFVSLSDLNLSLIDQLNQPQHKTMAKNMVENRLASRNITFDEYDVVYSDQSTSLSKTLIVLHAPVLAMLLMPLYWRNKFYFTDHIIFALYLMGFVMLFSILLYNGLIWMARFSLIEPRSIFTIAGVIQPIVYPLYFLLSVRRFYKQSWGFTLLKTILVILFFVIAHFVYRTLLFLIVFWST